MNKALFIFSFLAFLFIFSKQSYTQGISLSIYPPIVEIDSTPPASPTVPITIQNNGNEDIALRVLITPFRTDKKTGSVILDPNLLASGFYPYYAERIQVLEGGKKTQLVKLQALEAKELELNITLNESDPPGDYYFTLTFVSDPASRADESASQLPIGISTNILLSVGPKSEAIGGIAEFTTQPFIISGPVEFRILLHNAGKHVIMPSGSITITNMLGQKIGLIKLLPQYILAGEDRYLIDEKRASGEARLAYPQLNQNPRVIWEEKFLLGLYRADASVKLDDSGRTINSTTYFLAFPLYLFFIIATLIFVTLSIYLRVRRKV